MANNISFGGGNGGGGSSTLSGLSDVTLTSPTNGQVLKYDGSKWVNGTGGGSSGHDYSTTEQVVGTWIDGSTLYEKTCNFTGTFYGNTTVGNISVSAFDEIVDITGISKANDGIYKELVFAHPTASNNFGVFIKLNGDVELRSGGALTSTAYLSKIIITIRYTKSA